LTPERVADLLKIRESLEHPFGHECRDLPHVQSGLEGERRMIGFEQGVSGVEQASSSFGLGQCMCEPAGVGRTLLLQTIVTPLSSRNA
jgi:hypothetical protein